MFRAVVCTEMERQLGFNCVGDGSRNQRGRAKLRRILT
jgi:hypothetical protein